MSQASIQAAIDAHMTTLGVPLTSIAFQNTPFTPPDGAAYYETQMAVFTRRSVTIGPQGTRQWSGTYQVKCHSPAGEGMQPVSAMMDTVSALFPQALTLVTGDNLAIIFNEPDPRPTMVDGSWIIGPVMASWFAYEVIP